MLSPREIFIIPPLPPSKFIKNLHEICIISWAGQGTGYVLVNDFWTPLY